MNVSHWLNESTKRLYFKFSANYFILLCYVDSLYQCFKASVYREFELWLVRPWQISVSFSGIRVAPFQHLTMPQIDTGIFLSGNRCIVRIYWMVGCSEYMWKRHCSLSCHFARTLSASLSLLFLQYSLQSWSPNSLFGCTRRLGAADTRRSRAT